MSDSADTQLATGLVVYPGSPPRVGWQHLAQVRARTPLEGLNDVKGLAETLGVSVTSVRQWLRDPEYLRYEQWVITQRYEAFERDERDVLSRAKAVLEDSVIEAAKRLAILLEVAPDQKLQFQVAKDVLDRAGLTPVKRSVQTKVHAISPQVLERFEKARRDAVVPGELLGEARVVG